MEHAQLDGAGADRAAVGQGSVWRAVRVDGVPEHPVVGMQPDRGIDALGEG
ncbi:MAG: hypothetical protein ACRD0K_14365 [Egibacteraceae bacterium]